MTADVDACILLIRSHTACAVVDLPLPGHPAMPMSTLWLWWSRYGGDDDDATDCLHTVQMLVHTHWLLDMQADGTHLPCMVLVCALVVVQWYTHDVDVVLCDAALLCGFLDICYRLAGAKSSWLHY